MTFHSSRASWSLFLTSATLALSALSCRILPSSSAGPVAAITLPPAWTATPSPFPAITSPPPTPTQSSLALPSSWPFPTPSSRQIARARECQSLYLQSELNPPYELQVTPASQPPVFDACTAANAAYVILIQAANEYPLRQDLPSAGIQEFRRSIEENPAYLFHEDLFYGYFGSVTLVEAPPVSTQPISEVTIHYTWSGLGGDALEYNVSVAHGDSTPRVEITTIRGPSVTDPTPNVRAESIQILASALTNLVPIPGGLTIVRCTDNYPDWTVQLRFADGSEVSAFTNGSNFLPFGGPWQVEISGRTYVQLSTGFAETLYELVTDIELPIGQPAAMACFPVPVFTQVYGE